MTLESRTNNPNKVRYGLVPQTTKSVPDLIADLGVGRVRDRCRGKWPESGSASASDDSFSGRIQAQSQTAATATDDRTDHPPRIRPTTLIPWA